MHRVRTGSTAGIFGPGPCWDFGWGRMQKRAARSPSLPSIRCFTKKVHKLFSAEITPRGSIPTRKFLPSFPIRTGGALCLCLPPETPQPCREPGSHPTERPGAAASPYHPFAIPLPSLHHPFAIPSPPPRRPLAAGDQAAAPPQHPSGRGAGQGRAGGEGLLSPPGGGFLGAGASAALPSAGLRPPPCQPRRAPPGPVPVPPPGPREAPRDPAARGQPRGSRGEQGAGIEACEEGRAQPRLRETGPEPPLLHPALSRGKRAGGFQQGKKKKKSKRKAKRSETSPQVPAAARAALGLLRCVSVVGRSASEYPKVCPKTPESRGGDLGCCGSIRHKVLPLLLETFVWLEGKRSADAFLQGIQALGTCRECDRENSRCCNRHCLAG